jgi:hypothetical protein
VSNYILRLLGCQKGRENIYNGQQPFRRRICQWLCGFTAIIPESRCPQGTGVDFEDQKESPKLRRGRRGDVMAEETPAAQYQYKEEKAMDEKVER